MLICSPLNAAVVLCGVSSLLIAGAASAQQVIPPPPVRFQNVPATVTRKVPVLVQRSAAEGGGFKTEYREEQYTVITPQLVQHQTAEMEAANQAQALVSQVESAGESQREQLKGKLREALARQFEAQQKRRSEEIASIEERLGKLKETLDKRNSAKDAIIDRRLDQLLGVKDELAWEDTAPPGAAPQLNRPGWAPNVINPLTVPAQPWTSGTTPYAVPPGAPRAPTPFSTIAPSAEFQTRPVMPVPSLAPAPGTEAAPPLPPPMAGTAEPAIAPAPAATATPVALPAPAGTPAPVTDSVAPVSPALPAPIAAPPVPPSPAPPR